MSGDLFTRTPTPLERLIDEHVTAFRIKHWYSLAEWERETRARIHALANSHHRSVGQIYRQAVRRLAARK